MKNILTLLGLLFALNSFGQTVTYNEHVSCILYEHCTTCHHDGGIGPFGLMDYSQASAAAYGVMQAVNAGTMPPWPPNQDYNALAHNRLLTQNEIDLITDWVNGGVLEGPGTAPAAPVYTSEESITNPDLVLTMEQYTVSTIGNDVYRCFVIPTNLNEDVFITEIEIVPGNREAVHHVLLFQDETNVPQQLDDDDLGPGYTSFGGTGSSASTLIGGWVPGQSHKIYPAGMGVRIPAGADVVMQVHYPATANGQVDQSKVNIKYTTGFVREVLINAPLNHFTLNEGNLVIPPNTETTFTCDYQVPQQYDITVLDVSPHMHLLGKSVTAWAETPNNQIIPLIQINDWDFHWQGFYDFPNPIKIPAGSTIHCSATYDNTSSNPDNPNSPPQVVTAGEATTEEMMLVFFSYTLYFNGDENIVVDPLDEHEDHVCENATVGINDQKEIEFSMNPNPSSDYLNLQSSQNWKQILIHDITGKLVINRTYQSSVSVKDLPNGIYSLSLFSESETISKRFIVEH
jgi:hypothetical protein